MNIHMTMDDFTMILNALHYYKKVDKKGNFKMYTEEKVNDLRDRLSEQLCGNVLNDQQSKLVD